MVVERGGGWALWLLAVAADMMGDTADSRWAAKAYKRELQGGGDGVRAGIGGVFTGLGKGVLLACIPSLYCC